MTGKDVLDRLSDVIVREFIKKRRIHSCLPLAFIFYEEAKRIGYDPQLVKGFNLRREGKVGCRHYWVEVEGRVFDLTTRIYEELVKGYFPPEISKDLPPDYSVLDQEFISRLTETHFNLVVATGSTQLYFNKAPKELLDMRSTISRITQKLFKRSS